MNSKFFKLALCLGLFAGAMNNDGWSMNSNNDDNNDIGESSIGISQSKQLSNMSNINKNTNLKSTGTKASKKRQDSQKYKMFIQEARKNTENRKNFVNNKVDIEKELYNKFGMEKLKNYQNSASQLTNSNASIDTLKKFNTDLEGQIKKISAGNMTQNDIKNFVKNTEKYKEISLQAKKVSNSFLEDYKACNDLNKQNNEQLQKNNKLIKSSQDQINTLTGQISVLQKENKYITNIYDEFVETENNNLNTFEEYVQLRTVFAQNLNIAAKALQQSSVKMSSDTSKVQQIQANIEEAVSVLGDNEMQNNLNEINENMEENNDNIIQEHQHEEEEEEDNNEEVVGKSNTNYDDYNAQAE